MEAVTLSAPTQRLSDASCFCSSRPTFPALAHPCNHSQTTSTTYNRSSMVSFSRRFKWGGNMTQEECDRYNSRTPILAHSAQPVDQPALASTATRQGSRLNFFSRNVSESGTSRVQKRSQQRGTVSLLSSRWPRRDANTNLPSTRSRRLPAGHY